MVVLKTFWGLVRKWLKTSLEDWHGEDCGCGEGLLNLLLLEGGGMRDYWMRLQLEVWLVQLLYLVYQQGDWEE